MKKLKVLLCVDGIEGDKALEFQGVRFHGVESMRQNESEADLVILLKEGRVKIRKNRWGPVGECECV